MVAAKGGKFVIVRSVSTGLGDIPHTGMMSYDEKYPKIPAVTIGNSTADMISDLLNEQPVRLKLNSECGMK